MRCFELREEEIFFWATQGGAEVDLLFNHPKAGLLGFEFKKKSVPSTSKSMRIDLEDLSLNHLYVVYPGDKRISLDKQISALPLADLSNLAIELQ